MTDSNTCKRNLHNLHIFSYWQVMSSFELLSFVNMDFNGLMEVEDKALNEF